MALGALGDAAAVAASVAEGLDLALVFGAIEDGCPGLGFVVFLPVPTDGANCRSYKD